MSADLKIAGKQDLRTDGSMPALPWGPSAAWREANRTLDLLICLHRAELKQAVTLARRVQAQLGWLFALMDDLCAATCRFCPDPCCLAATVWIDFRDLLFLHLTRQPVPTKQLRHDLNATCRCLGPKGCSLPRISRPWVCAWYLCPPQAAHLRKEAPSVQENFSRAVQVIKTGRKEMEAEFIRVVS